MFTYKKKYFLLIENIKDINLNNIKLSNKIVIIYRNQRKKENIEQLLKFRKDCKRKRIEFYITNNLKLMFCLNADGIYVSSYNKDLNLIKLKNSRYKIIGSAHNLSEIKFKDMQGCSYILVSRLFRTSYKNKKGYLGLIKFNLLNLKTIKQIVPLGGIRLSNLNHLKNIHCNGFAVLSEVKKKPAKFISRLF